MAIAGGDDILSGLIGGLAQDTAFGYPLSGLLYTENPEKTQSGETATELLERLQVEFQNFEN